MNTLYTGLALVIGLLVLAFIVNAILRRRRKASDAAATPTAAPRKRRRWFWQRNNTSKRLRKWVYDTLDHEEAKKWLQTLPDNDIERLVDEISAFSDQAKIDLHWLLDGELERDENLLNAVKSVISLHIQSRFEAFQVADDIQTFGVYYNLVNDTKGKNEDLIKTLYAKLVEKEVVPTTPPELSMASSKEGREYAMEQIKIAAGKDWSAFSAALKEVLHLGATEAETTTSGRGKKASSDTAATGGATPAPAPSAV